MRVLITGGTGFIGAEIGRMLAGHGADVHATHRSGNFQRLGELVDEVTLHQLDLADRDSIGELVESVRPEVVYHFGAILTGPGEQDPPRAVEANAIGTYALLEAARVNDVRQVIFASSIGSYGRDMASPVIDDATNQRPMTIYGVTKVFGEHLGWYYRRKYGLDFRGIRYPSIVGPGVKTPSIVQFTSWMIEEPARGNEFTVPVSPGVAIPILYYRDAARAAISLAAAPFDSIETVNYLVDGPRPTPNVGAMVEAVKAHVPDARITFEPDSASEQVIEQVIRPLDDGRARAEWGWEPAYDLDGMIADFLAELEAHPERYA
jgi:threonine 3-dehydrogenase